MASGMRVEQPVAAGVVPSSPLKLFVKHTFIDVEDDAFEVDPRRSSSEPPSCRHSGHGFPSLALKCAAEESDGAGSTASGCGSPRGSVSDATSDDGAPPSPAPSQAGPPSPTVTSRLNPHAAVWTPALRPVQCPGLGCEAAPRPVVAVVPLPPVPPPPPELSVLAMIPSCFAPQFQDLFSAAAKALSGGGLVTGVRSFEAPGLWGKGMKIAGSMNPEKARKGKDAILKGAQKALLKSAEESQSVYVMGYALRPFTPTEGGFAAMLGGMRDDGDDGWACWDMLQKGFCSRRGACCKQHPECMIPIYVEIDG